MNTQTPITGKTLIDWGYSPGPWFKEAVKELDAMRIEGRSSDEIRSRLCELAPPPVICLRPAGELSYTLNIRAENPDEVANLASVERHMAELMRLPTVKAGAVMPDACPAGSALGTIPVGGVIAAENAIHPGMHSADICCSMAVSMFGAVDGKSILDAGMKLSHFGGGGRARGEQVRPPSEIIEAFDKNPLLKDTVSTAIEHFATQGDGNHFFYVGRVASTGKIALVTHHGSRKPGAMLYKRGLELAERFRKRLSPETPKHNAWIPADTREGEQYWEALQTMRAWTKANHFAIHDRVASTLGLRVGERFWNEHNFVFQKSDGIFYHAKGATPAWQSFASDSNGLTLIPLNMAQPVLITRGLNANNGLGFAPHGAGRNFSRSEFMKRHPRVSEKELVEQQTAGIDARFFFGIPDISELPGAYKDAAAMRASIREFGLAEVIDTIDPIGSIMAGNWQRPRRERS